ncbi:MAG: alpha/beta fold hydrolase, partial [Bacteroidota bacterium]
MQLPNQGLDSFSSIEKALNDVRNLLWVRFSQANYLASISTAFGDTWNINDLDDLITPWKQGNFSRLPAIEVRPAVEISGADGAFSSDTGRIYLAAEYISAHRNDQSAIQRLLLEEIGHFIDAQINPVDAPGDEGALFAALILGEELSQGELKSLREEDDSGVATVNGAEISIEQADVNAPHQLSGGTNGDTTTIDLGGTSGEITLEFNSLYNLDRIQLFFEGEYLPFFDSDEIPWNGSFSRVIPFNGDSREIIVRVLSDTEQPSGTALWGYEISSEIDETEEPFIPPVEVRNLTIEDRDVETGEFFESDRIVDGNKAKVSAIIKHNENSSREIEVFVEGLFKDSSSKIIRRIIGEPKTIFLSGKDTQEVEFSWDTTGFAWETGNQPASDRDIQIIVRDANSPENTKPLATSQESVEIIPQPVVLAHGLWSNAEAWDSYIASDGFLAEVHPQWQGFAVDTMNTGSSIFDLVNPFANTPNSINENSEELNKFIDQVRLNTNAENVDIVAHSMGGLISRKYIQDLMPLVDNDEPVVDELIMLGTPNNGSPLADVLFSGILLSKVTKGEFLSAQSASEEYANIYQLQTEYLKNVFNPRVYDRKDVDFSILAGVNIPLPINPPLSDESASPSYLSGIGDGVVPESNALYINRVENGKLTQEL